MASVALNVISGLIEVSDSRNVILPVFPQVVAVVVDHDGGVPHSLAVDLVTFQNGRDDDHIVALGKLKLRLEKYLENFRCYTSFKKAVVGPESAGSAYSHQGIFSLVQNAKGISEDQFFVQRNYKKSRLTPSLLEAEHVHPPNRGGLDGPLRQFVERIALLLDGDPRRQGKLVLKNANAYDFWRSQLFRCAVKATGNQFKVVFLCLGFGIR
jgi:hypothetical protein